MLKKISEIFYQNFNLNDIAWYNKAIQKNKRKVRKEMWKEMSYYRFRQLSQKDRLSYENFSNSHSKFKHIKISTDEIQEQENEVVNSDFKKTNSSLQR